RALRKGVEEKLPPAVRVLRVLGLCDSDKFNRDGRRTLVQKLEHRVLRVGPRPAPGDRRRRSADRLAVGADGFSVRFHFQLLEIGGKKAKPLVISEDRAGLAALRLDVEAIGESGD